MALCVMLVALAPALAAAVLAYLLYRLTLARQPRQTGPELLAPLA
jgi:hypothetical protein